MNGDGTPIQNVVTQIQYLFSGKPAPVGRESILRRECHPHFPVNTDANGEFLLRGLPQGGTTNLEFQGQGYAKEIRRRVPVGTKGLEFRLKREARVEGRLSYAGTDAPVKNAIVALTGIYPTDGWEQTSVGENGNYLLKNLPAGVYNLYLEKGPEGWTASANALIKLVEGQTVSDIDLTLVRGGFITGRVADRDTNEPIADHHIRYLRRRASGIAGTESRCENGRERNLSIPCRTRQSTGLRRVRRKVILMSDRQENMLMSLKGKSVVC